VVAITSRRIAKRRKEVTMEEMMALHAKPARPSKIFKTFTPSLETLGQQSSSTVPFYHVENWTCIFLRHPQETCDLCCTRHILIIKNSIKVRQDLGA
jgi:hypothetical protein